MSIYSYAARKSIGCCQAFSDGAPRGPSPGITPSMVIGANGYVLTRQHSQIKLKFQISNRRFESNSLSPFLLFGDLIENNHEVAGNGLNHRCESLSLRIDQEHQLAHQLFLRG